MKLHKTRAAAICLGIVSLLAGLFISHKFAAKNVDMSQFHGAYLEQPRTLKPFSLVGIDNKAFNNASLQGHWTVVFFGFTNCGYVCPTTMAELSKMYKLLESKGVKNLPQVVMVSVDPERDTKEKLASYVHAFHPSFYGATAEEAQLQLIAHELGVAYEIVASKEGTDPENYDIQHTGAIMLFNPQGALNAFFTSPHQAELLVQDYLLLVA